MTHQALTLLIIATVFATTAQANLPNPSRALQRLTQERIVTPIPQDQGQNVKNCAEAVQEGIKNFYREESNRQTKNEAGTATVFADSLKLPSPYAEYITIRIAEKERAGERERLRQDGFNFYNNHARAFFPQEILGKAAGTILDPYGQIQGLAFYGLQNFVDLFDANGKHYFIAYQMDSIRISGLHGETGNMTLLEKALKILQELASKGELKNLDLSFYNCPGSSLMVMDAIHRFPKLLANLHHLSLHPGGAARIPKEYRFNGISSLWIIGGFFENGSQVLAEGETLSHLVLDGSPPDPEKNLLDLIKNPLRMKHLSVTGSNDFPRKDLAELKPFQNLTHLTIKNSSFMRDPGRFSTLEIAALIDELPNLTHFTYSPSDGENMREIVSVIKTLKSPSIKEVGIFSTAAGVDLDEMMQREGLPPIRLVGHNHIHW